MSLASNDARSPSMTRRMSAAILKLNGSAFCPASPIGGLLVYLFVVQLLLIMVRGANIDMVRR